MKVTLQGEFNTDSTASQARETNQTNGHSTCYCYQRPIKKTTQVKIPEIGLILGSRHHTSNATASQATSTESRTCTEPLSTPTTKPMTTDSK